MKQSVPLQFYMPLMALRGMTIFPHMSMHFDVGRAQSIQALEEAMEAGGPIFLVAQRDMQTEHPKQDDLYEVGTICTVRQILHLPGGNVRVMVEGSARGRLKGITQLEPCLKGEVERIEERPAGRPTARVEALIRSTYECLEQYAQLNPKLAPDILMEVLTSEDPGYIADCICQNLVTRHTEKQHILDEHRPVRRLEQLKRMLQREIAVLNLEQELAVKTRERFTENQRAHYMREQLKTLKSELGEEEDNEAEEYRRKIAHAQLPQEVEEKLLKEVQHLERQPVSSAEAAVSRNYLDLCLELPWGKRTKERADVAAAEKILNRDHYGLEKVKDRILEFIAVRQLAPNLKGQILCLVGPPGVGKTSIASSIAKALNRKMARISLGGIHDEAEIRGHRKTYVGAMPGRIITAIRQAGSQNPLLLLDEIDKIGSDHRGDPASALLEVLDSEQNVAFRDHFLEVPFDLSDVLFVLTANTTSTIPRPLLDRMEVFEIPSYTDEEKLEICKRYLLPKQRARHGLSGKQLAVSEDAIRAMIVNYTKESGVRVLERQTARLCRKAAKQLIQESVKRINITDKNIQDFLGVPPYAAPAYSRTDEVGIVNGLAWTQVGGELLPVEANVVPGTGKVELTGNLGNVMKESCSAALSYIRSRAGKLNIPENFYKTKDIHVHFPEGAVPKDGPSAGIAITTAMVSALTGLPVRQDLAMTGEVTLRGRVLPIGGLREKTMAALRNGIHTVIIPEENRKDLEEIDPLVRQKLQFLTVSQVDEVLDKALRQQPAPKGKQEQKRAKEAPADLILDEPSPAERHVPLTQ